MRHYLLALILFCFFASSASAEIALRIEGLPKALEENVGGRVSRISDNKIANTPYFRRYLESEISKGLRAEGYYEPQFSYKLEKSSFGKDVLVVNVQPGQPVLVERVSVNITGDGLHDKDYINLLRTQTPSIGDVINHGDYDNFKKNLLVLAQRKGYFDAELTRHQLAIADNLYQGFWRIDFETGQRYRFGDVTFRQDNIQESYLRNIIPFKEGEYYSTEKLALFGRRLSSTNWFHSVSVLPIFSKVTDDKELPIVVIATPRKPNVIDLGIGYATDIGMRGNIGWSKPWINSYGHSFQSKLNVSKAEQTVQAGYKIPLESSPLEDYYIIQSGYKREDNNDTESNAITFSVMRYWDTFEGWQKGLGINVDYDRFVQGADDYNTFLIYPSVHFSRIRYDNRALPMWGDSQRYSFDIGSDILGSNISFWAFKTQQVWLRSLYNDHRFITRVTFGFIDSNDFERVPPSFRFFVGGDRSIRGYKYQSISPRNSNGKLEGASRMLTGSLEYQYHLTGAWWGALFVDSGEAVNNFNDHDFYTGAGFGVRWVSPIGPIKLDIAKPIGGKGDGGIQFYLGLGAEL